MGKNFYFYHTNDDCNNLILFVHGFTGDKSSWENANGATFPDLLKGDAFISDNFDIASYQYFTTLLDLFASSKEKFRMMKNLFKDHSHTKEKNLDIPELAENLSSHLRFSLGQYSNIYIVAHSMGGLISKSLIINDLVSSGSTKVKIFISLAVPHLGAEKATLGKIISSNIQIDNLRPVCDFIGQLNEQWIKTENKPITKYFYGSYDQHVTKTSALAIESDEKDVISIAEDHNSIAKPENENTVMVKATAEFIKEVFNSEVLEEAGYLKLDTEAKYDDELFVVKLIVAGIDSDVTSNAKELFLNAEYARKLLKSKYEKKRLEDLFNNIQQLYRDSYDKFLAGGHGDNSGLLLAEVHEKISSEDSLLLKSMTPTLKVFHKKGMLHQIANNKDCDVWWTKDKNIKGIE